MSRIQQQILLHRRDAEFTEIRVIVDQELFTLRPQRLRGEFFLIREIPRELEVIELFKKLVGAGPLPPH